MYISRAWECWTLVVFDGRLWEMDFICLRTLVGGLFFSRGLCSSRLFGSCSGVTIWRAGGVFQIHCGIGRLSWLTSGL